MQAAADLLEEYWEDYSDGMEEYRLKLLDEVLAKARLVAGAYKKENEKTLITREWLLNAGFKWDKYGCIVNGVIEVVESDFGDRVEFQCYVDCCRFEPTVEKMTMAMKLFDIPLKEEITVHAN